MRRDHWPEAEAEAAIRRALDIRPTYAYGRYYLGLPLRIIECESRYKTFLRKMKLPE